MLIGTKRWTYKFQVGVLSVLSKLSKEILFNVDNWTQVCNIEGMLVYLLSKITNVYSNNNDFNTFSYEYLVLEEK